MPLTFLQAIGSALTSGLKASIEATGMGDGKIKLVYTPDIGETPENASDAVTQLRSAIEKPMVLIGTPNEVEEAFSQRIVEKSAVVSRGLSALDEIDRLVAAAVDEAKASRAVKAGATVTDEAEPDDDDSLELVEPAVPVAGGDEKSAAGF